MNGKEKHAGHEKALVEGKFDRMIGWSRPGSGLLVLVVHLVEHFVE
jgi:hypothetical protein